MTPLVALALALVQQSHPLLGAHEFLERVRDPRAVNAKESARATYDREVREFGDRSASLAPQTAAKQWLGLVDQYFVLTAHDQHPELGFIASQEQFDTLVKYLPAPESWPSIEAGIQGQGARSDSLRLLMSVLQGHDSETDRLLAQIDSEHPTHVKSFLPLRGNQTDWFGDQIRDLRLVRAVRAGNKDEIVALLKQEADGLKPADHPKDRDFAWFDLPPLVPLLGRDRARELITYILTTAKAEISSETDGETLDLARQIAVSMPSRLAAPQWTLAQSMDIGDFFSKLDAKSTYEGQQMSSLDVRPAFSRAVQYYFASLFESGQTARAKAFAESHVDDLGFVYSYRRFGDQDIADRLERDGKLEPFLAFLARLVLEHPDSMMSQLYFDMAHARIAPAQQEKLVRELFARRKPDNNADRERLASLYLEENKPSDAIRLLPTAAAASWFSLGEDYDVIGVYRGESGVSGPAFYYRLGKLAGRSDLVERAVKDALKPAADGVIPDGETFTELLRRGDGPAIEKALIGKLKSGRHGDWNNARGPAQALLRLYFAAGRYQDVLTLLEQFPDWGVSTLDGLTANSGGDLAVVVAKSLVKVGRTSEAVRLAYAQVPNVPSNEDWVELIAESDPTGLEKLAAIERSFPHEPAPAFWRAKLLFKAARLPEAEASVRRAIALDPDDVAHWSKPNRFEARLLLAEILQAEGNSQEAEGLKSFAAGAEWSLKGDRYESVGMTPQALSCYQKAVEAVRDDFASWTRLAAGEFALGDSTKGVNDLDRALWVEWRMLPTTIDPFAYGIPEQTLLDALLRAQAHLWRIPAYWVLIGQLLLEAGDAHWAGGCFKEASQIDKNCEAAWEGLSHVPNSLPPGEAEAVYDNLVRLDGGMPSYYGPRLGIPDYTRFWRSQAEGLKLRIRTIPNDFVLTASRRSIESGNPSDSNGGGGYYWGERLNQTPGEAITSDDVVQKVLQLIAFTQG